MRALSDALPTGHRAMANPTLRLHFGCGRATPPVSHSHNWPSGRMQNFLFKIGQKSYFLPIRTPKPILTIEWCYRSMYCRSNAMIFFTNGQFEGDIIFCHLKFPWTDVRVGSNPTSGRCFKANSLSVTLQWHTLCVGIDCYILDAVVPATTPQIKEDQHLFN